MRVSRNLNIYKIGYDYIELLNIYKIKYDSSKIFEYL